MVFLALQNEAALILFYPQDPLLQVYTNLKN